MAFLSLFPPALLAPSFDLAKSARGAEILEEQNGRFLSLEVVEKERKKERKKERSGRELGDSRFVTHNAVKRVPGKKAKNPMSFLEERKSKKRAYCHILCHSMARSMTPFQKI